jgi:hypothetical protein
VAKASAGWAELGEGRWEAAAATSSTNGSASASASTHSSSTPRARAGAEGGPAEWHYEYLLVVARKHG